MKKRFWQRMVSVSTWMYTLLVAVFAFCLMMDGSMIMPVQLLKLLGMALAIGLVTALRMELDELQWMLRLSFMVKRLIFVPVYFGITLVSLLNLKYPFESAKEDIWMIVAGFCVGFILTSFIKYIKERKNERKLNLALESFQDEVVREELE